MSDHSKLGRRDFFKVTGAGLATAAFTGGVAQAAESQEKPASKPARSSSGKPRRIIFLVADGMSMGAPSMAESLSQLVRGRGTHLIRLLDDPNAALGYFETHSLNSLVTDSAAAASAWGSGSRVFNGAINMLPDGTRMKSIGQVVKESGRGMGLVTTTRLTHATPAGFGATQPNRGEEEEIAPQYMENEIDVLLGGGRGMFESSNRKDSRDLLGDYKKAGYTFWEKRDELIKGGNAPEKVLGLFWNSHLPYTVDRNNVPEMEKKVPTLAEMTQSALESLDQNPEGFLLQVEGGRVDHGAHGNDAAATLWDQIAFDDAVGVALEYAKENPDTLVVVTTDHGTANPGLNGMGPGYADTTESFERLANARGTYGLFRERVEEFRKKEGEPSAARIGKLVSGTLGVELTSAEEKMVTRALNGELPKEVYKHHQSFGGILGQIIGNHTGIGWTSMSHTSDNVLIASKGPGQEHFGGFVKNHKAFPIITGFFDIDYKNPAMTAKQAEKHLSYAPTIRKEDWA